MSFLDKFMKKKPTASGDALKQTSGNTPKKAAGAQKTESEKNDTMTLAMPQKKIRLPL